MFEMLRSMYFPSIDIEIGPMVPFGESYLHNGCPYLSKYRSA
jgi:hypothetical protein